jgi:hypothetical protein
VNESFVARRKAGGGPVSDFVEPGFDFAEHDVVACFSAVAFRTRRDIRTGGKNGPTG